MVSHLQSEGHKPLPDQKTKMSWNDWGHWHSGALLRVMRILPPNFRGKGCVSLRIFVPAHRVPKARKSVSRLTKKLRLFLSPSLIFLPWYAFIRTRLASNLPLENVTLKPLFWNANMGEAEIYGWLNRCKNNVLRYLQHRNTWSRSTPYKRIWIYFRKKYNTQISRKHWTRKGRHSVKYWTTVK
jgi:hypothetical protein